mmetsp:Transcript_12389/g.26765  ORF Transcript_12389/g.26765 Transcript_12389/m.26765 type:complete len:438 (+) Transcript_12389:76-1389(+)
MQASTSGRCPTWTPRTRATHVSPRFLCSQLLPQRAISFHVLKDCGQHPVQLECYASHSTYTNWLDEREKERKQRREIFTLEDWKRHRSNSRFLRHLSTIKESGVIKGVVRPVCFVIALTTVVALYNHLFTSGALPPGFPAAPAIAIEPIQLTSFALSLLLVFRTNASYARWDEARRKYGSITTTGRDIARQAFAWFPSRDMEDKAAIARWLVALAKSSMVHFQGTEQEFQNIMKGVLRPEELEWLTRIRHRPNFCIQMITKIIARAGLPTELVLRMDENISTLIESVAACERIINTPVPLSYTRHTARFLMAWLACMPFSLWNYCGWAMVPIAALISFVLLGIEEIGVYIEEPFSLLPLDNLADKLQRIVQDMMVEHQEIEQCLVNGGPAAPAAAGSGQAVVPAAAGSSTVAVGASSHFAGEPSGQAEQLGFMPAAP